MKKIALLFILVLGSFGFTQAAKADVCEATLENRVGNVLRYFTGSGYDQYEACENARIQCKRALSRMNQRRPGLRCRIQRGGQQPRRQACRASMKNRRGMEFDSFTAFAQNRRMACMEASRQCNSTLRRLQRNGRRMSAYCEVSGRGGQLPPRRDVVQRTCSADRIDRAGYRVGTHFGQAQGRRGTGVKQRACADAMRRCKSSTRRREICRVQR